MRNHISNFIRWKTFLVILHFYISYTNNILTTRIRFPLKLRFEVSIYDCALFHKAGMS